MIPSKKYLKENLGKMLETLEKQGFIIEEAEKKLKVLPDSYDEIIAFAKTFRDLPLVSDWEYVEPLEYDDIELEMSGDRLDSITKKPDISVLKDKTKAGFISSVMGCILGKPLEIDPTYDELKKAGQACGQWPVDDYISEEFLQCLGKRKRFWPTTTKGNISFAEADDDINYSVLGMLILEKCGMDLDYSRIKDAWIEHICMTYVYGPERHLTAWAAINRLEGDNSGELFGTDSFCKDWARIFNPGTEICGALIRADAYGFAFAGRPDLAAKYAYIDASFTHQRTGVYSAMYVAALIALMYTAKDPVTPFKDALKFVPQKSRFKKITENCIDMVEGSNDFEEAYYAINKKYGHYRSGHIYQEVGCMVNSFKYARDIWHGVCFQVMQGLDTDSFGCSIGSALGAYFGMEKINKPKLEVFNDTVRVTLASFFDNSITGIAERMAELTQSMAVKIDELEKK